jgi:2-oxoglutarate ferredoxin oxidoreductase subunit alpha
MTSAKRVPGTPEGRVLISGNEAAGEGAVQAGCRHYYGYPITPQNELTAYMARRMAETGGTFVQAESEVAAINMVFGTALAGERAMTSSSSPGISLKQEGISYLAGCELPAVIVNMQRGGPGLGNIAPSQADYFQATRGGGHGDYRTPVLAPWSVQETADLMAVAFDLADAYRTPVMVLGDGRLGQMLEPARFDNAPPVRRPSTEDWALTGSRGRPPRSVKSLLLNEDDLEAHNAKLQARYAEIAARECRFAADGAEDAELLVVAYGTAARICTGAALRLREEGARVGVFRPITLWPFPAEALAAAAGRAKVLVVEMSAGQMVEDVLLSLEARERVSFYGRTGGSVPAVGEVAQKARELLEGKP